MSMPSLSQLPRAGDAMASQGNAVPAWQTDDLAEEWIEEEGEEEQECKPILEEPQQTTKAIQCTFNARGAYYFGTTVAKPDVADEPDEETTQAGTVVVHSDRPSLHLPQTPALGKKKGAIKDIFSPLQLERLFDPPSPPKPSTAMETPTPQQRVASSSQLALSSRPPRPSKLSQVVGVSTIAEESEERGQDEDKKGDTVETDMPNASALGEVKATPTCHFTFSVPRSTQRFPARIQFDTLGASCSTPNNNKSYNPQLRKTPFPSSRPQRPSDQQLNPNDSRLRLFQFQYDTYTRDHLSAIVDSFGISSPSNISNSRQSMGTVLNASLQKQDEDREDPETFSRLRAAKRLKLTPPSEFTPVATLQSTPHTQRPNLRRDYVGEARSFMQKIKRARGLSLISVSDAAEQGSAGIRIFTDTTNTQAPSTRSDSLLPSMPSSSSTITTNNTLASKTSSTAYRKQAEDLMAKIKGDPKVLSGKSDTSLASQRSDEEVAKVRERSWAPSPDTRPTSPVKKFLENKENEGPELDRDPPSYAASIALNRGNHNNPFVVKNRLQLAADTKGQRIMVMPVTIPEEISPITADRIRSPNPTFLAPPILALGGKPFSAQLRSTSTAEDLNRLVSSGSTATTTTTLTVGSAGSCVKHAGPPHMVHIAPADLPPIPERVNGMVFDRALGRWIKERGASDKTVTRSSTRRSSLGSLPPEGFTESEDPFRDIESLRDSVSIHAASPQDAQDMFEEINYSPDDSDGTADMDIISSDSDSIFDDSEEAHVSTFTFDRPPTGIIQVMMGKLEDLSENDGAIASTDSEGDTEEDDGSPALDEEQDELYGDFASMSINEEQSDLEEGASTAFANARPEQHYNDPKPADFKKPPYLAATPIRPHRRVIQPPRSALKSTSVTPISRGGRSVSFSDGRKEGKIIGLHTVQKRPEAMERAPSSGGLPSVSARSKRVMQMLEDLEESLLDDDDRNAGQEYMQAETLPQVPADIQQDTSLTVSSPRSFARSQTIRRPGQSSPRRVNTPSRVNATFLTECSFGVAHDRLVEVITDVQPFEPYWDSLTSIDLSGKRLDSVARLKEFLPKLDSLNLNDNLLSWLSGVPNTVRTLSVASNALTSLTSFGHLKNLENLDLSYNDVDSLQQLKCLRHLRELRADGNKIAKLDGLEEFDGLLKLSLENNQLHAADLTGFQWSRLELLNLSNNRLESVCGLDAAPALVSLNLDNNLLPNLEQPEGITAEQDPIKAWDHRTLHKLRILRLSGNRLKYLNVARFPNLRTLYVDNNCLAEGKPSQRGQDQRRYSRRLHGLHRLSRLENFSARNQSAPGMRDSGLQVQTGEVRDIKRLYLSGNPSPMLFGTDAQACYNLVYLELAACRLTSLPAEFSSLVPNVRALNLNYNFLETDGIAHGLAGLKRLRKLTIVGNRMTGTKPLVKMLSIMGQDIEMLDFRMNPCTLGWYLPLLVQDKDNGALLQPSEPAKEKHHAHAPFPSALPPTAKFSLNGAEGSEEPSKRWVNEFTSSPKSGQGQVGNEAQHADGGMMKIKEKRNPSQWEALDAQFRRGLPDKAYVGRLAYRGLIMRACPHITVLDGVRITEKEKRKAEALLKRVLKDAGSTGLPARVLGQR